MATREERQAQRDRAARLSREQGGVVSRAMLRQAGIDRFAVAREVQARRWRCHGRHTIATHTGDLSAVSRRWRAVWEAGRTAAVDGVTALQAAGLDDFTESVAHVSITVPPNAPIASGIVCHRVERLESELMPVGVPRVRPHIAAIRAAHWAVSDKQAALILCMVVQQGITTAERLADACSMIRTRGRTGFVRQIVADLTRGAESLGEIDFARACRRRGLPEPERQVVRQDPNGRIYLDVRWAIGLVVEIDGAQHRQGLSVTADNLRRNNRALDGDVALTIDLVGLRLCEESFMDQVQEAISRLTARNLPVTYLTPLAPTPAPPAAPVSR